MKLELIKDWMSFDVITVSPDMSLSDAYQLMTQNKITRLPVLENGRLTGMKVSSLVFGD